MPPIFYLIWSYVLGVGLSWFQLFPISFLLLSCVGLGLYFVINRTKKTAGLVLILLFLLLGLVNGEYQIGKADKGIPNVEQPDWISQVQTQIDALGERVIPGGEKDLLLSLVFGSKAAKLDADTKDNYRKAGLSHLLVASGMQVALLAAAMTSVLGFLRQGKVIQFIAITAAVIIFGLIAGGGASIIRSVVMVELAWLAKIFLRYVPGRLTLLLAAFAVLIFDPAALFGASFQLTFAATYGLLALSPQLKERFELFAQNAPMKFPSFLTGFAGEIVAPVVMTLPVCAFWFHQVSLIGLIANMLVLPFIGFLTIFGIITIVIAVIFMPLAQCCGLALSGILFVLNSLIAWLANLPMAVTTVFQAQFFVLMLAYLIFWLASKRSFTCSRGTLLTSAIIFIVLFQGSTYLLAAIPNPGLTIEALDVGQGDSLLVQDGQKHAFLVDGGDRFMGNRVVGYLAERNINKLDFIILTHPHDDHVGGLVKVLENIKVDQVYDDAVSPADGALLYDSVSYRRFRELIQANKIKATALFAGQTLHWGTITLEVINPQNFQAQPPDQNPNNNSIAFRLRYAAFTMLFTGDMEEPAEQTALKWGYPLTSQILKVGHHGSHTATSQPFLSAVSPQSAVISVGKKNKFHHPHPSTVKRLEAGGISVYRTDRNGTVKIVTDGAVARISSENQ